MIDKEDFSEVHKKYSNNPDFDKELNYSVSYESSVGSEMD